jgi:hypothetical protein
VVNPLLVVDVQRGVQLFEYHVANISVRCWPIGRARRFPMHDRATERARYTDDQRAPCRRT